MIRSTFGRGLDAMVGTYVLLDLVPKGRDEDGLPFSMQWVRHHDRYGAGNDARAFADADQPYWPKVEPGAAAAGIAAPVGAVAAAGCCGSGKDR